MLVGFQENHGKDWEVFNLTIDASEYLSMGSSEDMGPDCLACQRRASGDSGDTWPLVCCLSQMCPI